MLLLSSVNQRSKQIRMIPGAPSWSARVPPSINDLLMSGDGPAHRFTRPPVRSRSSVPSHRGQKPDESVACKQGSSAGSGAREPRFQSPVMERVATSLLLLCILTSGTDGVLLRNQDQNSSQVLEAALTADLSAVLRRVDPRFLSVTIDASLAADEKFMYLLRWVLQRSWVGTEAAVWGFMPLLLQ